MTSKSLVCGACLVLCLLGHGGRGNAMLYQPQRQMISQANQYQPSSTQYQQSTQIKPNPYQPAATYPQPTQQQSAGYPQTAQQQTAGYPQPTQQQTAGYPQPTQQQTAGYPQPTKQQAGYPQQQQAGYPQPPQQQPAGYPQPPQQQPAGYPQPPQQQQTGPYGQPVQAQQTFQSQQQYQNQAAYRPQYPQQPYQSNQYQMGPYQQNPYQQNQYQQPFRQTGFQQFGNYSNPFGPTIAPKRPTKRIAYIPPCQYLSSRPTPRSPNFAPFELETYSGGKTRIERGWPVQVGIKQWDNSPYLFEHFTDFIVYAKPVSTNAEGGPIDPYKPVGVFMTDPMYAKFMAGGKGFKCNRGSQGYDAVGSIDEYTQEVQKSIYGHSVPGLHYKPPARRVKAQFMWFPSEGAMKATGIQFVAKINIRGEWFKLTSPTWPVYNPPSPEEVFRRQMSQFAQIQQQIRQMEMQADAAEARASRGASQPV